MVPCSNASELSQTLVQSANLGLGSVLTVITMNNSEKDNVLPQPTTSRPSTNSRFPRLKRAVVLLAVLGLGSYFFSILAENVAIHAVTRWYHGDGDSCPQVDVLVPQANGALWNSLGAVYASDDFKTRAVDWLGGAVRVP